MPRLYRAPSENSSPGTLVIETLDECCFDVFYIPSKERLEESGLMPDSPTEHRVKLLHIDCGIRSVTIFPIRTRPHYDNFLKPKYDRIERITIEDWEDPVIHASEWENSDIEGDELLSLTEDDVEAFLERLPKGFIGEYDHGLGLTQRYRFIVRTVQELSTCTEIVISPYTQTVIDEEKKIFYISLDDFYTIRKSIDRTMDQSQSAARSVNYATTRNILAERTRQPLVPVKTGRSPLRRTITEAATRGEGSLSQDEQDEVLNLLVKNTKSIAMNRPDKLTVLKKDIELVTLEALIERYEEMMNAKLAESSWQDFLSENSFLLNLAFGYPVVKVRDQASVGGHKLSGAGGKFTDFLVKNSMTNNSALVEIKKPSTKLLNLTKYREGIYAPSGDLVGAVSQILDQKHIFELEIAHIKVNSRIYDIESYSVRCCLIVGTMPDDEERLKSFELFRGNSKNVDIITFDELLEKLKRLRDVLISSESEATLETERDELPF